ncbi:cell division protein FtsL [Paradevosia shaoguanensis]|jgi:hypothetical protein|uniref:Cell division protein FtsL n=1 Tax=Paradevosia shaoguanensis TaxID=1335043 RepID=A0AA41UDX4_9HYPH|nr:hypothetical protein [Paradevosia shaoguanensis]KFL27433.1 hypothetical protein JP74_07585 [Devosia sp. 17-2-E-8]MBI4045842.1 hypothetical protein [Devosia nanyangense]QMV01326.1 hypothetical protein GHV40_07480 [Devosia sp. D6-9]CDP50808.1 Cell division protein FtsL [Devosia sp. DBB001]MCF1743346.1 hypothetical protein [Paradevosia shaoguanensis]
MIRNLNIILTLTSIVALVAVYALKYSVEETASAKSAMERTISRQEADLSLLKADWAYLNQPAHVGPIVTRHAEQLDLQPLKQAQISSFDIIPMRPVAPDNAALTELFESLETGVDPADAPLQSLQ